MAIITSEPYTDSKYVFEQLSGEIFHCGPYRRGRYTARELFEDVLGVSVWLGCNDSRMCGMGSYDHQTVPLRGKICKSIHCELVGTNVVNRIPGGGECLRNIVGE